MRFGHHTTPTVALRRQSRRGRSAQRVQKRDGAQRAARLWRPGARCALSGVLAASQELAQELAQEPWGSLSLAYASAFASARLGASDCGGEKKPAIFAAP